MANWWEEYKKKNGVDKEAKEARQITTAAPQRTSAGLQTSAYTPSAETTAAAQSPTWWEDYKEKNGIYSESQAAADQAARMQRYMELRGQLSKNRASDAVYDTVRNTIDSIFGGGLNAQGKGVERSMSRYERDLPLYQQALDAASYSPTLYGNIYREATGREADVKNQFAQYTAAREKAQNDYLENLKASDLGAYYGETMSRQDIEAALAEARSAYEQARSEYESASSLSEAGYASMAPSYQTDLKLGSSNDQERRARQARIDAANQKMEEAQAVLAQYQSASQHRASIELRDRLVETATNDTAFSAKAETGRGNFERNLQQEKASPANEEKIKNENFITSLFGSGTDTSLPLGTMQMSVNSMRAGVGMSDMAALSSRLNNLDEDLKNTFYYWYGQSQPQAVEYLDYAEQVQKSRDMEKLRSWSKEHPVLGTLGAAGANMVSGADFLSALAEKTATGKIGEHQDNTAISEIRDTMHEGVSDNFNTEVGKFLYQVGTSLIDSRIAMATGNTVPMFFLSAASSEYLEAKQRGASDEQALLSGALSGLAECVFEEVSVEKLINRNKDAGKSLIRKILEQSFTEASEEVTTSLANTISDTLLSNAYDFETKVESRARELMATGVSAEEAKKQASKEWALELLRDAAAGGLSGGASQVLYSGVHYRQSRAYNQSLESTGKAAIGNKSVDSLRQYALDNNLEWYGVKESEENAKPGKLEARQTGSDVERIEAHIQEQISGKSLQEQQEIRDQLQDKYGDGILPSVYQAISIDAAQRADKLSGSDAIREARNKEAEQIQDADMRRAVVDGYDQAVFLRAAKSGDSGEAGRYFQQLRNTGTGEMAMEATVKAEDGTEKKVAITGMSEDGKRVVLADGVKIDVADLQADSDTLDAIQQLAGLDLGKDADAVLQAYKASGVTGTEGYRWLMDYATAYNQGRTNQISLEEAVKRSSLDDRTVMEAYTLGQKQAHGETQKSLGVLAKLKGKQGATGRKANIDTSRIEGKTMNASERRHFELANKVFASIGVDVTWFASDEKDGRFVGKNGAYEGGKVWLDIHAGRNYTGDIYSGVLATTAHELTHFLQQYAPEQYQSLKEFVFQQIVKKARGGDMALERLIWEKQRRSEDKLSRKAAEDEVVADACQTMLRDSKAVAEFAQENEGAAKGMIRWLDKWFNKIRDAFGKSARLSEEARLMDSLEKDVRKAFGKLWDEALREAVGTHDRVGNMESASVEQMSLRVVEPVQPSSDAWTRGHDEAWFVQNGYPIYRDVSEDQAAANEETGQGKRGGRHGTQISSTKKTYQQVFDLIRKEHPTDWQNMRVLDASSGLGLGTRLGREAGFNVTDIEPFPSRDKYQFDNERDNESTWEKRAPDYEDYSKLEQLVEEGKVEPFDYIISNAVLNVIPQDTRDNLTVAMGNLLAPGGQMFVNVISRNYGGALGSRTDIQRNAKGVPIGSVRTTEGDYTKPGNVSGRGHETFVWMTNTVQKVFSYNELVSYLQDALGPGYSVEPFKAFGMTAAMVTKDGGIQYSERSLLESVGFTAEPNDDGLIVARDSNGNVIKHVTAEHIEHSGIGALINYAATSTPFKRATISQADAKIQKQAAADLVNMILKTNDGELVWRFAGSALFSAVKSNSDGQYGTTVDFSTVCRKTQEMVTAMSEAMTRLKRGLTKDEVIELQKKILEEKGTVPCPVCYVFSRWAGVGGILDNMYKFQQKYGHEYDDPAVLQARIRELEAATKTKADLRAALRQYDTIYMELAEKVENLQAENKSLNKQKPRGKAAKTEEGLARIDEINKQVKANNAAIEQAKKDMKKLEDEGAPELAWLKRVRSAENYWETGNVPAKVLFNLDDAATFAEKYSAAWSYRTTRGPSAGKAILPYSDMQLGDLIMGPKTNRSAGTPGSAFGKVEDGQFSRDQQKLLRNAIARVKAQNLIGGQRYQSTSDFRYDYGLDYLQSFWEAQALGSNMQTYTKIVEFAEFVATIGGDVNLSVMPLQSGLDENGNLIYSSVTGINAEAAVKVSRMFDSAQLILVGINDEHIRTALDDFSGKGGADVGFVIPYHASGASINRFIRGLVENLKVENPNESFNESYYKDYSPIQTDSAKKIKGANEDQVKAWMEAIRENPTDPQFEGKKPTPAQRTALDRMFLAEIRQAILKHKVGSSKEAATSLVEKSLDLIRGKSEDITGRSFEALRAVEKRALDGDPAAIREYSSWSAGVLWDLYNKMWVDEKAEKTYGVELSTSQAHAIMPHEYWNKSVERAHAYINGFIFRSYCFNLGLNPRFTGVDSSGKNIGYGDFSDSTGYWKTLIDRAMYDNQGRYRDQQTINITDVTKDIHERYEENGSVVWLTPEFGEERWGKYKVREPQDVTARRAAERFVDEVQGRQFSERDYDNTISDYDLIMGSDGEGLVGDQKTQLKETKERISRVQGLRQKLADTRAQLKAAEKKIAELEKPGTGKFAQQMRAAKAEAQLGIERAQGKDRMNRAVRAERDKLNETRRELRKTETKLAKQIQREEDILSGKLKLPAIQKMLTAAKEAQYEKDQKRKEEQFAGYKDRQNKTAIRNRIKNLHAEMQRDLLKPREGHFVPEALIRPVVELLDMVNTQTKRAKSEDAQAKIDAINAQYDKLKKDERFSQYYDETVKDMLVELSSTLAGRSIYELNSDELADVYTVMKAMRTTIRNAVKADLVEKGKQIWEVGNELRQELRAGKGASPYLLEKYHMAMLSAERAFHRFGGYQQNSTWDKVYRMLDDAQLKMLNLEMQATRLFDPVLKAKADLKQAEMLTSIKEKDLVDVGLKDADGNAVKITRGMMLSLYMHMQNEENMRHLMYGGMTLPDYKRYYKSNSEAWGRGTVEIPALGAKVSNLDALLEEIGEQGVDEKYAEYKAEIEEMFESVRQNIEEKLTDYDRKWIAASKDFFDGFSRQELNKVTNEMYGFSKARVDNYFPIVTDSNFLKSEFESVSRNISLENAGFMKERVKASNPILLEDITRAVNRQISNVSRYAGLTQALKTFGGVYNVQTKGFTDSVKKAMAKSYGKNGQQYVENLITDMIGGRSTPGTIFDKIKGNYAQAVLSANLSVTIKQAASFPTAAATVGWGPIMKALAKGGRNGLPISRADRALIDTYTPLLWKRAQGAIDTEIGDMAHARDWTKKAQWLMGWIQKTDLATVGRLWSAAEYYVQDNFSGLEKGSEAQIRIGESPFYQKVAEVFNQLVEDTQPNYTVLQRPDILRNPNKLVRAMTMFSTQRFQNANILIDAVNEYAAMVRSDRKRGTAESKAARKAARQKLTRAISSQVVSAVVLNAMTLAAGLILHRMNPWRDDDDELTAASILKEVANGFASTMAGSFLAGSELYEAISSMLSGSKYYGNDVGGISTINDFATAVAEFGQKAAQIIGDEDSTPEDWQKLAEKQLAKVGQYLAQMTGIPVANVNKIIAGGKNHVIDAMNGEFFSFEAGVDRSNSTNARRFYRAWETGDKEKMQDVLEEVRRSGKSQDSVANAFNKAAKEAYQSDEISLERYAEYLEKTGMFDGEKIAGKLKAIVKEEYQAGERSEDATIDVLTDLCGMDADKAWKIVQRWEANAEHADQEDYSYSQYDAIDEAIAANKDIKALVKELTDHGVEEKSINSHVKSYLVDRYVAGSVTESALKNQLSRYLGIVAKDDVDKILRDANCKKKFGVSYSGMDEEYRAGKVSGSEMKSALMKYGGLSSTDADKKIRWYDLQKANPNLDVTEAQCNNWYDGSAKSRENGHESAKSAGMSIEAYLKAKAILDEIKDQNGNNSGEDEVIAALKQMSGLTSRQKDALYYERYKGTTKISRQKNW